ncbi:MAG TPA: sucrase ferredoxin [Nocardia sp.]|uniref:sucrase ferredoxin n=1 Tax=Nocardia sp. TaxID=1821 RepID=UPI002B4AEBFC|nr:sucrase ferredoxin [Nocardia sp.]HLS78351.1 sucrase ferredoxin [Nocardia sp.]
MNEFAGLPCSTASAQVPLPGTATRVGGWLCVEHPGAWGRDVLGDEVLGPRLTAELAARTAAAKVRPTLIRRPGRHEFTGTRTVLLAASHPTGAWCERLFIDDLDQLLDLDLSVVHGQAPGLGEPVTEAPVLVCAHGKRDRCCARLGRPVAASLAAVHPGRVWECSHTGGHRFAPAMVLLPSGLTYGRVDAESAAAAVAAVDRGEVSTAGLRGRSGHSPVEQVAELAVRERIGAGLDDLIVATAPDEGDGSEPATHAGTAVVTHRDGRRWRVVVRAVAHAPRQAGCDAGPKPVTALVADTVAEIAVRR